MSDSLSSYEAETALLNIVITNPELAFEVQHIKPYMFSSVSHTRLFDLISQLVSGGAVPDRPMIETKIKESKQLNAEIDLSFFETILEERYAPENLDEYCTIVSNAYKTRELISISTRVPNRLADSTNIDDVLLDVKLDLDRIDDVSGGKGTLSISELAPTALQVMEQRRENPNHIDTTTGFYGLDLLTGGYQKGMIWVWAARPSVGKTAMMLNAALRGAEKGVRSLIMELEMDEQALMDRLASTYTGINLTRLRLGNISDEEFDKYREALTYFGTLPLYFDTTPGMDVNYVKSTAKKYNKIYGIEILYVDYLQLMVTRNENQTAELGRVMAELKILSRKLGIQSVVLSQVNRELEKRDDKRPTLADLRQSGNIEEDADLAGFLYRPDMYQKGKPKANTLVTVEFLIKKHRNGATGLVPLEMLLETNLIQMASDF
jgi:replicative DNA helicase